MDFVASKIIRASAMVSAPETKGKSSHQERFGYCPTALSQNKKAIMAPAATHPPPSAHPHRLLRIANHAGITSGANIDARSTAMMKT